MGDEDHSFVVEATTLKGNSSQIFIPVFITKIQSITLIITLSGTLHHEMNLFRRYKGPKLSFFGFQPYCFILLPVRGAVTRDVRGGQEVNLFFCNLDIRKVY